ncbi:hypothetical protein BDW74DRAFT_182440 [Aspergillus multicolor]|uniref:PP2C family serine/threonine-protein phosphatase n=1 Tax=Aspergillus multicolor TaxID=41759 RepID=UPI003CCE1E99
MDSLGSRIVKLHAVGAQSAQGSRPDQQDTHIILTSAEAPDIGDSIALFAVFDGHGTPAVSTHAKEHIPRLLLESAAFKAGNYEQAMQEAIDREDDLLMQGFNGGEDAFAVSGSTASLALLDMKRGVLVVGNIGDSHVLMAERESETGEVRGIDRLTTSHKPEDRAEKARIEKAGGQVQSQHDVARIGSLNMSRALGDLQYKTPLISAPGPPKTDGQRAALADPDSGTDAAVSDGLTQNGTESESGGGTEKATDDFITVQLSFRRVDLRKDAQYVLALTSDGVTNVLSDDKIMEGMVQMFNAGSQAEDVARVLVDQAVATPYSDNATCVAVFLNGTEAKMG